MIGVGLALVVMVATAFGGYSLMNSRTWQPHLQPPPDSGKEASAEEIVAETVVNVRPGSIILLHVMYESGTAALAAVPRIVAELRSEGYRFVTVSDLLTR